MKIKYLGALAALLLAALPLRATKIDITSFGAQPGNSGQGTIESWMASLVAGYNAANNPDLPAPGAELFRQNQNGEGGSFGLPGGFPTFGAGTLSITIPGGFDYIGIHWGGPGGGTFQAFYVGGTANTFTAPGQNGLSWYDGFGRTPNQVPDNGSALLLLGTGLTLLVAGRRIFAK